MHQNLILLPVFAQVILTYVILMRMGPLRSRSIEERGQITQDVALAGDGVWNESALKASNNYKNQFEIPALFYAVTAFALITGNADPWMLVLAWAFVLSRIVHSIIHVGVNVVLWRATAFAVGASILALMWLLLMWRVAVAGF